MGAVTLNFIPKADANGAITGLIDSLLFDDGANVGIDGVATAKFGVNNGAIKIEGPNNYNRITLEQSSNAFRQLDEAQIYTTNGLGSGLFAKFGVTILSGRNNSGQGGVAIVTGEGTTTQDARIFVDINGNVGFGNIAPAEVLDVTGNIKASVSITGDTLVSIASATIGTNLDVGNIATAVDVIATG